MTDAPKAMVKKPKLESLVKDFFFFLRRGWERATIPIHVILNFNKSLSSILAS